MLTMFSYVLIIFLYNLKSTVNSCKNSGENCKHVYVDHGFSYWLITCFESLPKTSKKHLPGSKVVDILKVSSSSESGTKKKKSQSIGNLKVKKKDGTSGRRKSQSDGIVISAADSARIKEKKMKSRDALGDDKKRRTSLNNAS